MNSEIKTSVLFDIEKTYYKINELKMFRQQENIRIQGQLLEFIKTNLLN